MSEDRAGLLPEDDDRDLFDELLDEDQGVEPEQADELPEEQADEPEEPPRRQPSRRQS